MTPKERAEQVVQAGFDAREIAAWGLDDGPALEARIASAVRAAEQEALEKAVAHLTANGWPKAAREIRSLASRSETGGGR